MREHTRVSKKLKPLKASKSYNLPVSEHELLRREARRKNDGNSSARLVDLVRLGRAAEKAGWTPQAQDAG